MSGLRMIVVLIVGISGAVCIAAGGEDLTQENEELRSRVERLEKEVAQLKKLMMQQAKEQSAEAETLRKLKDEREKPVVPRLSAEDLQKILAMVEKKAEKKKAVWSNLDIELYGYIKADAAFDSGQATAGNYMLWVDEDSTGDSEFNLTANQTRIGFRIKGPEDEGLQTSGLIEMDFYGGGAENKARMRMRHAYLKLDWPEERFNVIAGQTWDVFSPLYPGTLNFTILWDTGNIGYRHPQIRLTKGFTVNDKIDVELAGAISRTIGDNDLVDESGEDSGHPTFQGRVGVTFPLLEYKPTTVGFSGHWGKEEYSSKDVTSWSVNTDLTQPVNKWLSIKAEAFVGENLDNYFGGIGQGVNADMDYREIGSKGGWLAANIRPWKKWQFNLGAGVDNVEDDDIGVGDRKLNRSVFGNVIYSINENTQVGFELSHWRTEYKGAGDAEDVRAQTSFIYKF